MASDPELMEMWLCERVIVKKLASAKRPEEALMFYEKLFELYINPSYPARAFNDRFKLPPHYTVPDFIHDAMQLLAYGIVVIAGCPIRHSTKPFKERGKWNRNAFHSTLWVKCTNLQTALKIQHASCFRDIKWRVQDKETKKVSARMGILQTTYTAGSQDMSHEYVTTVQNFPTNLESSPVLYDVSVVNNRLFGCENLLDDIKWLITSDMKRVPPGILQSSDAPDIRSQCWERMEAQTGAAERLGDKLWKSTTVKEFLRLNGYYIQNMHRNMFSGSNEFGSTRIGTARESVRSLLGLQEYGLYVSDSVPYDRDRGCEQVAALEFTVMDSTIPDGFLRDLWDSGIMCRVLCCEKGKVTTIKHNDEALTKRIRNSLDKDLFTGVGTAWCVVGDEPFELNILKEQPTMYMFCCSADKGRVDLAAEMLGYVKKHFKQRYYYGNREAVKVDDFQLEEFPVQGFSQDDGCQVEDHISSPVTLAQ